MLAISLLVADLMAVADDADTVDEKFELEGLRLGMPWPDAEAELHRRGYRLKWGEPPLSHEGANTDRPGTPEMPIIEASLVFYEKTDASIQVRLAWATGTVAVSNVRYSLHDSKTGFAEMSSQARKRFGPPAQEKPTFGMAPDDFPTLIWHRGSEQLTLSHQPTASPRAYSGILSLGLAK
jgi:hypothetical protein